MDLNLRREPKSDLRAFADQAYAASAEDEARCLQSWLPMGVTDCNCGPAGVAWKKGPESEASKYRAVYLTIS